MDIWLLRSHLSKSQPSSTEQLSHLLKKSVEHISWGKILSCFILIWEFPDFPPAFLKGIFAGYGSLSWQFKPKKPELCVTSFWPLWLLMGNQLSFGLVLNDKIRVLFFSGYSQKSFFTLIFRSLWSDVASCGLVWIELACDLLSFLDLSRLTEFGRFAFSVCSALPSPLLPRLRGRWQWRDAWSFHSSRRSLCAVRFVLSLFFLLFRLSRFHCFIFPFTGYFLSSAFEPICWAFYFDYCSKFSIWFFLTPNVSLLRLFFLFCFKYVHNCLLKHVYTVCFKSDNSTTSVISLLASSDCLFLI